MMDTTLFDSMVQQDTPRLVVMVKTAPDGSEAFQWGIVGGIPMLSLVGAVVQAQYLIMEDAELDECQQEALVIVWVKDEERFLYFAHPKAVSDGCAGMLEVIKATLVDTQRARKAAAQQILLGSNGMPVR